MKRNYSKLIRIYKVPVKLIFAMSVLIFSLILLLTLITASTPDQVGPLGVTALFILVFVVTLSSLTLMKMLYKHSTVVTMNGLVGWSLVPALFLGLGTLKQLTILDIVLIGLFAILLSFYIKRATKNSQS